MTSSFSHSRGESAPLLTSPCLYISIVKQNVPFQSTRQPSEHRHRVCLMVYLTSNVQYKHVNKRLCIDKQSIMYTLKNEWYSYHILCRQNVILHVQIYVFGVKIVHTYTFNTRVTLNTLSSIYRGSGYNIQYPVSKMTTEPYPAEYGASP